MLELKVAGKSALETVTAYKSTEQKKSFNMGGLPRKLLLTFYFVC